MNEQHDGAEEIPAVLFDGAAVYHALSPRARLRTSPENVADVLDAIVHVLKQERAPAHSSTQPEGRS